MGKLFAVAVSVIALVSAGVFLVAHLVAAAGHLDARAQNRRQLVETMIFTGVLFVAAQLALAMFVWQSTGRTAVIRIFPGGPMPLVGMATVIVGLEVMALVLVGTKVWSQIFLAPRGRQRASH